MRIALLALSLAAALLATPAEARRSNNDRTYNTTYPRCGTVGCVNRHETAARTNRVRDRPTYRSRSQRSRH